jgi:hypothetical protein
MNIIDKITEKLNKYPDVAYELEDKTIKVLPCTGDGFEVSLSILNSGFVINFDGWHEEIEMEEDALNWFAFGLCEDCRLKVISRGSYDYKWVVERRTDTGWKFHNLIGLLFFPFWRAKRERYLQNHFIKNT